MENRAHALAAGLFVVVLSLAVGLAFWWFGGKHVTPRDVVLVTQRNVNGLNPLAQVRYRGISAGKVIRIALDPKDARNIEILVRIDASLPLTRGTTAQLNSQGITGLAYVQLEDNGQSAELLPVDDENPPRIIMQQTLFESMGDRANDILVQVGTLVGTLNRVLDQRNLTHLDRTLANVAVASEGLREVPQVVGSVKQVLSPENLQRIRSILQHLEKTAGESAPLTTEMRSLVGSMQSLSRRLEDMTGRVGQDLTVGTLPQFDRLVVDLQTNSRQMKRILDSLEKSPQSLIFGPPAATPGPGEAGFSPSAP
ncbi:MAG: MCE family protein [Sterolibacterium sp.]|nr:MCE family protein [Sterolibacterium sp.]MBP9799019.1 MCE family protein [Sterolibacterium sp.]